MWTTKRHKKDHYVSQLYCQSVMCSLCVPTAVLSECDVDNKDTRRKCHYVSLPSQSVMCNKDTLCVPQLYCQSVMWTTKTQEERIDHYVSLQLYCQKCDVDNKDTEEIIDHYVSLQRYCQSVMWTTKTQERELMLCVPTAVLSECDVDNKDTKEIIDHYVSLQLYCQSVMWTTKTQREADHYVSLHLYCQSVMWTTKTQRRELITMYPYSCTVRV
ncbi:unnamed protein product [Mytilus edulis]|uniref:Uncharacterized protein n=1 Tax=Mytilus edulis TaxID=6550 RepID=A0A8S3RSS8_MYTED|nr:unnamed protein product [Mytilus edulis]